MLGASYGSPEPGSSRDLGLRRSFVVFWGDLNLRGGPPGASEESRCAHTRDEILAGSSVEGVLYLGAAFGILPRTRVPSPGLYFTTVTVEGLRDAGFCLFFGW